MEMNVNGTWGGKVIRLFSAVCMVAVLPATTASATLASDGIRNWHYELINGDEAEIVPHTFMDMYSGSTTAIWHTLPTISADTEGAVTIPAELDGYRVTSIATKSFIGCTNLTSVTIPYGVTNIAPNVFQDCVNLSSFEVNENNPAFKVESGLLLSKDGATLLAAPSTVTAAVIPAGVTDIRSYAFYHCAQLASVSIPAGVTNIGERAFFNCEVLSGVDFPDTLSAIGGYAFYHCTGLQSVVIPDSVTSIGNAAFKSCGALETVFLGNAVKTVGDEAFYLTGPATLYHSDLYAGPERIPSSNLQVPEAPCEYRMNKGLSLSLPGDQGLRAWTSVTVSNAFPLTVNAVLKYTTDGTTPTASSLNIGLSYTIDRPMTLTVGAFVDNKLVLTTHGTYWLEGDRLTETVGGYTWNYSCWGGRVDICGVVGADNAISPSMSPAPTGVVTIPPTLGGRPVKGIMSWAFYNCTNMTGVVIPPTVTAIGWSAFADCTTLAAITFPDSVESIAQRAFDHCTSLGRVWIPDNVRHIGPYAFFGCSGLEVVAIGNGVEEIGEGAFDGTSATLYVAECYEGPWVDGKMQVGLRLTPSPSDELPIGSTLGAECALADATLRCTLDGTVPTAESPEVGAVAAQVFPGTRASVGAFIDGVRVLTTKGRYWSEGMTGEETVGGLTWKYRVRKGKAEIFNQNYQAAVSPAPSGAVTIPVTLGDFDVAGIGAYALYNCTDVFRVTLPAGVTSIGEQAFAGCKSLAFADVPEAVTNIDSRAFAWCDVLSGITIPCGVRRIGGYAFDSCTNLSSVVIGNNVEEIGSYTFQNCSKLTGVNIPDSVTTIGNNAFYFCTNMTSVTIGNGVRQIGDGAFYGCSAMENLTIGNGLTTIGQSAFAGCTSLSGVTLPPSVTEIGGYAFRNCLSLSRVNIPDGVTAIRENTFNDCSLTSIVIPDSVRSISWLAFDGCTGLRRVFIGNGLTSCDSRAFEDDINATFYVSDIYAGPAVTICQSSDGSVITNMTVALSMSPSGTLVVPTGKVRASCAFAGATLRYTTDGTTPTVESPALPDALTLTGDTTVSVAAFLGGERILTTGRGYETFLTLGQGIELESEEGGTRHFKKVGDGMIDLGDFDFTRLPRAAYDIAIAADGKSAAMTLRKPVLRALDVVSGVESADPGDKTGMLVNVDPSLMSARPAVTGGMTLRALAVQTYPGLSYQAMWGDSLDSMTKGAKVKATGDSLYLGVIRQEGASGFYGMTVSED